MRAFKGVDIRSQGSGNIGATNVWRTYGRHFGIPVVLLDTGKGFVPALVGTLMVNHLVGIAAGAAAMAGHYRPLFLRFAKGGKMVAACGGAFFGVAPLVAVAGGLAWLAVFLVFRFASLASIAASISLVVFAILLGEPWAVVVFAALAALAVILLHRANISRLWRGTEHRVELRRRGPASA